MQVKLINKRQLQHLIDIGVVIKVQEDDSEGYRLRSIKELGLTLWAPLMSDELVQKKQKTINALGKIEIEHFIPHTDCGYGVPGWLCAEFYKEICNDKKD